MNEQPTQFTLSEADRARIAPDLEMAPLLELLAALTAEARSLVLELASTAPRVEGICRVLPESSPTEDESHSLLSSAICVLTTQDCSDCSTRLWR